MWLWLEATRCNPTQGPIRDNLRLKQFRQISGNYSQGLVAITSTRLTGRQKDILTGLGKTHRIVESYDRLMLIGAEAWGQAGSSFSNSGLTEERLTKHQACPISPQLPLHKHTGEPSAWTHIRSFLPGGHTSLVRKSHQETELWQQLWSYKYCVRIEGPCLLCLYRFVQAHLKALQAVWERDMASKIYGFKPYNIVVIACKTSKSCTIWGIIHVRSMLKGIIKYNAKL